MAAKRTINFVFYLLVVLELARQGAALRSMRIVVADAVRSGEAVHMRCDYDLEQAALYSIKWYRGDEEFYRYVPKEAPPARVFPVRGVHVDVSQSDARTVSLIGVQKELSGIFRCEVSADAPLFHTDIRAQHMQVADVPAGKPTMVIDKDKISAGEKLRANCSAGPAFPPANLTWYIDEQQVSESIGIRISHWTQRDTGPGGLQYSWSSLELLTGAGADSAVPPQTPRSLATSLALGGSSGGYTAGRHLRVRCLATLFSLYRQSAERDVALGPPMGPSEPSRSTQQRHQGQHVHVEQVIAGASDNSINILSTLLPSILVVSSARRHLR